MIIRRDGTWPCAMASASKFDIRNFFGEISHERPLAEVARRVSARRVVTERLTAGCCGDRMGA
jgi:hypothetical protein